MNKHKVRLIILLGAAVAAPFLAGRFIGLGWGPMAIGMLILVVLIGILRLGGRVKSALRKGGEGYVPEEFPKKSVRKGGKCRRKS